MYSNSSSAPNRVSRTFLRRPSLRASAATSADECDKQQLALAALGLLAPAQRVGGILEVGCRLLELALDLLVVERLRRALAVDSAIRLPCGHERATQVVAQLLVLDQALDILVGADRLAGGVRSGAGLRGLLLRCHCSPRIRLVGKPYPACASGNTKALLRVAAAASSRARPPAPRARRQRARTSAFCAGAAGCRRCRLRCGAG